MTHHIRILALITDGFGGQGGISQYNRDLLTALSDADAVDEIVVVPRLGQAEQEVLPVRVRQQAPVFNKIGYSLCAMGVAAKKGPFHLVFCGHISHSPLAVVIARSLNIPLWLQLHGIDAWTCPHPLTRWAVEQSDLVTVVSRYTKRRFLGWANIQPERVRVLPNTVADRYSPGPKSAQLLEQYGLRGKRILLTVSRISLDDWYKGHHRVLAIMPDLLREYPDLVYVVAGDGNGREKLQQLALEHGVADSVKFIGKVSEAQLPDMYRTADVFVMPSSKEGFGIVFLEAMRSGIPAIGGNSDGSMDPLRDCAGGYAVSCENKDELLDAIRSALENPRDGTHYANIFSFTAFSEHCTSLLSNCLAKANL
jgi:phosphatidylinositol alpha-1,6-mannosyltransferase